MSESGKGSGENADRRVQGPLCGLSLVREWWELLGSCKISDKIPLGQPLTPASPCSPHPPVKWKEDGVGDCSLQDHVKGTQEAGSWGPGLGCGVSWGGQSKLELPTEGRLGWALRMWPQGKGRRKAEKDGPGWLGSSMGEGRKKGMRQKVKLRSSVGAQ